MGYPRGEQLLGCRSQGTDSRTRCQSTSELGRQRRCTGNTGTSGSRHRRSRDATEAGGGRVVNDGRAAYWTQSCTNTRHAVDVGESWEPRHQNCLSNVHLPDRLWIVPERNDATGHNTDEVDEQAKTTRKATRPST